jgi:Ricin-type beta-trefoil lectin domain
VPAAPHRETDVPEIKGAAIRTPSIPPEEAERRTAIDLKGSTMVARARLVAARMVLPSAIAGLLALAPAVAMASSRDAVVVTAHRFLTPAEGAGAQPSPLPPVNRPTEVINDATGKCLDDTNRSKTDGTIMQQWSCFGDHPNQEWIFRPVPRAHYEWVIHNAFSRKCLDDKSGSHVNGNKIRQWACNGRPQQKWAAFYIDGNGLAFLNMSSGLALDVNARDRSILLNGDPIDQRNLTWGATNQTWHFG